MAATPSMLRERWEQAFRSWASPYRLSLLAVAAMVALAVMVGLLVATGATTVRKSPYGTVEAFYELLNEGRDTEALLYLSSDARGHWDALGEAGRQAYVRELTRDRTIAEVEFAKVKLGGDRGKRAQVAFFVTYENDDFEVRIEDLIREGGRWKLLWSPSPRKWREPSE